MRRPSRPVVVAVALTTVVVVLIMIGTALFLSGYRVKVDEADAANSDKQVVADVATSLADQVEAACREGGDDADALQNQGLCRQASVTKTTVEKAVDPNTETPAVPPVNGRDGQDGDDGRNGRNGPTLSQVVAELTPLVGTTVQSAIDQCVASGRCVGPKGDGGSQGPRGEPGPRVVAVACAVLGGGTFTFTFDDGSSISADCSNTADPDDQEPEPAPEPAPEPTDAALLP